jgi:hypothetical protein
MFLHGIITPSNQKHFAREPSSRSSGTGTSYHHQLRRLPPLQLHCLLCFNFFKKLLPWHTPINLHTEAQWEINSKVWISKENLNVVAQFSLVMFNNAMISTNILPIPSKLLSIAVWYYPRRLYQLDYNRREYTLTHILNMHRTKNCVLSNRSIPVASSDFRFLTWSCAVFDWQMSMIHH